MFSIRQFFTVLCLTSSIQVLANPVIQAPEDGCTKALRQTALPIIKANAYIKALSEVEFENPVYASTVQRGVYIVPACGGSVIFMNVKRDRSGWCTFSRADIQVDVGNLTISSFDPSKDEVCKKRFGH